MTNFKQKFLLIIFVILVISGGTYSGVKIYRMILTTNNSQKTIHSTLNTSSPTSLIVNENESDKESSLKKISSNAESTFSEQFDSSEKKWLSEVKLIIDSDELYYRYTAIRDGAEALKLKKYEEFHQRLKADMAKKPGPGILVSQDKSPEEMQVNKDAEQEILQLIGPEKFKIYLKSKDLFNENLRRNHILTWQMEL